MITKLSMMALDAGDDEESTAAPPRIEVAREHAILAVFMMPPAPGEQLELAFRRKEHELCVLFAQLSVSDARVLHRRLVLGATDDPIAAQLGRMVAERRARLIGFLADARRRDAFARVRTVGRM
jgi:hypothetical protein